jgi:hypothetical protein
VRTLDPSSINATEIEVKRSIRHCADCTLKRSSVDVANDGRGTLLSAGADGTVRLWDPRCSSNGSSNGSNSSDSNCDLQLTVGAAANCAIWGPHDDHTVLCAPEGLPELLQIWDLRCNRQYTKALFSASVSSSSSSSDSGSTSSSSSSSSSRSSQSDRLPLQTSAPRQLQQQALQQPLRSIWADDKPDTATAAAAAAAATAEAAVQRSGASWGGSDYWGSQTENNDDYSSQSNAEAGSRDACSDNTITQCSQPSAVVSQQRLLKLSTLL